MEEVGEVARGHADKETGNYYCTVRGPPEWEKRGKKAQAGVGMAGSLRCGAEQSGGLWGFVAPGGKRWDNTVQGLPCPGGESFLGSGPGFAACGGLRRITEAEAGARRANRTRNACLCRDLPANDGRSARVEPRSACMSPSRYEARCSTRHARADGRG